MFERRIRASQRGVNSTLLMVLAFVSFLVIVIAFLIAPAYFLALVLILAGFIVIILMRANPYGITLGVVLAILGVVLALIAQAQQLSLSFVHAL